MDAVLKKVCIYYPSIQVVEDSFLYEKLLTLYTEMDNIERWKHLMSKNFDFNIAHEMIDVERAKDNLKNK